MPAYGAGPFRMLARAMRKRCPRCGSGGLFHSWFKMRDRCPRCGYRFVREEGFWLGGYVINFAVAELALGVVLIALLVVLITGRTPRTWVWIVAGVSTQFVVPALFFPFSRTVWAAFDLIMHPLEAFEEADAIAARATLPPPPPEVPD